MKLHYVEAGDPHVPLVVLLHGFPEGWYSWRHQLPALAEAGYYAVAPDLRGYGRSEKPVGVAAYRIERLVEDVDDLVRRLSPSGRAHAIVGHDWGGGITWATAQLRPETVERVVVINCPPPRAVMRAWRHPRQWLRSWYVWVFQVPRMPELLLRAGGLRFVDAALTPAHRRNPTGVTAVDATAIRRELMRPGALTASINYYRAALRPWLRSSTTMRALRQPIEHPTLLIWGENDPYLGVELLNGMECWAPRCTVQRLPRAGHFCHQEYPDVVNQRIVEFLRDAC